MNKAELLEKIDDLRSIADDINEPQAAREKAQAKIDKLEAQIADLEATEGATEKKATAKKVSRETATKKAKVIQKNKAEKITEEAETLLTDLKNSDSVRFPITQEEFKMLEKKENKNEHTQRVIWLANKSGSDLAKKAGAFLRKNPKHELFYKIRDVLVDHMNYEVETKLPKNAKGEPTYTPKADKSEGDKSVLDTKARLIEVLEGLKPELNLPIWGKQDIFDQYVNVLRLYVSTEYDVKFSITNIENSIVKWLKEANSKAKSQSKTSEDYEKIKAELKEVKAENKELKQDGDGVSEDVEKALNTAIKALTNEPLPRSATIEEKAETLKAAAQEKITKRNARKNGGSREGKTKSIEQKLASPFLAEFRKRYREDVAQTKMPAQAKIKTVESILNDIKYKFNKEWYRAIEEELNNYGKTLIENLETKSKKENEKQD